MAVADRPVCLILQPIHPVGAEILNAAAIEVVAGADAGAQRPRVVAVITRDARVDSGFIDRHPALRVIGKHGAGLDAIDVSYAAERCIAVLSTPGTNAQSVAELAMLKLLALARRLPEMTTAVKAGDTGVRYRAPQHELFRGRLGLIGFGHVGRRIAAIARLGLQMQVRAYSPSVPDAVFADHGVERSLDLDALLRWSDFVSSQAPHRPGSPPVLGAAQLRQLRRGAIVVNVGRGGAIDETAACEAIATGQLGGLGLDVLAQEPVSPASPLLDLPNVIVTPHIGGSSLQALEATARRIAEDVAAALRPPAAR